MKPAPLLILLALAAFSLNTAFPQGGSTGLTFLTLGVGSRSLAMAEAYTAATGDPASIQYNPATLGSAEGTKVSFMHRAWIQGTNAEYLAGSFKLGALSLGTFVYSVSVDDIEVRDTPGPALSTFTARYASLGIAAAYAFSPEFSFGATMKYLYEKILVDDAGGTAFDIGATYTTPVGVRVGAAISNLGSMSELGSEATALPKLLRGGVSWTKELSGSPVDITASLDFVTPLGDGTSHALFGGEALLYRVVSVRAGYQTGYEARGFTAGTGIRQGIVTVDYAFMPTEYDLGSTHAITLTLEL
jgi:hypothetical protein